MPLAIWRVSISFNLSDFNLKTDFVSNSFHLFLLKRIMKMKTYLSIISLLFFVVSLKAQTTNSTQQNSTVNIESHKTKYVNIYTNPSAKVLVIKVNEPKTGMEILLYNALGQEVDRVAVVEKETQYLRRNLSKGIYTFSVLNNKEVVETGKLVFE
jgi:hypothetical protein